MAPSGTLRIRNGFTLVELVVVILLLGVLAAVALPRFLEVRQPAHEASVEAVGGAFTAAVNMVHARWLVDGSVPNAQNIIGFGLSDVDVNANGWPTDTNGASSIGTGTAGRNQCARLLQSLLIGGPSVSSREIEFHLFPRAYAFSPPPHDPAADYWVTVTSANQCSFEYRPFPNLGIEYNCSTGTVVVDSDGDS